MIFTKENITSIISTFQDKIKKNTATEKDYEEYFKFLKEINPNYKKTLTGIINNSGFDGLNDFLKQRKERYKNGDFEEFPKFTQKENYIINEIHMAGTLAQKNSYIMN